MNKTWTLIGQSGAWMVVAAACLAVGGCMVGPNYKSPPVDVANQWAGAPAGQVNSSAELQAEWWKAFNDPVLDKLVATAYQQNLTLRVAGLRVLEARASRGIDVGNFFPQTQQLAGGYSHIGTSPHDAQPLLPRRFDSTTAFFDVAWEVDVWGKFRRGIESADAQVYSSVMNYDDALVTLVADVATTYVTLRGLDERIRLAQKNVEVQQGALNIANVRFRAGGTTELDVQQATTQLNDTESLIPVLRASREQSEDQLCILLGIAPRDLHDILGDDTRPIPTPPDTAVVGIPADLLRRRPDIRRAEADAAAQSAQIGVAVSDLLPHFQLNGTIGFSAENASALFDGSSLAYQMGPSFRWDILNYGRIINNVRVQDARFEELLVQYQNTVLSAQRDVKDAITSFIHSKEQSGYLTNSVAAGRRSVDLSLIQYKAGGADFIRVLNATQVLVQEEDNLVVSRINIASSIIALNKALGGGWELHREKEFVPPETIKHMRDRTDWGNITSKDYDSKKDLLLFPRSKTTSLPDSRTGSSSAPATQPAP